MNPINTDGEDYDIYIYQLGCGYKLTEKSNIEFKYSYEEKTSNIDIAGVEAEYDRSLISLSYTYTF